MDLHSKMTINVTSIMTSPVTKTAKTSKRSVRKRNIRTVRKNGECWSQSPLLYRMLEYGLGMSCLVSSKLRVGAALQCSKASW